MARGILEEFGDAKLGEWIEDRPKVFHLRRRLSASEELRVGEAVDCRTTQEGRERFERIKDLLPIEVHQLAEEELSDY